MTEHRDPGADVVAASAAALALLAAPSKPKNESRVEHQEGRDV